MTKHKILISLATITLLLGNALAVAGGNHGERANQYLDHKGDRIEQRMDRRGGRVDNRLDRKGQRIERHARNRR